MKIRTVPFLYILFSFSKLWVIWPWLFTWWVFPGSSAGKESACNDMGLPNGSTVKNMPAMQETQGMWVWSLGWEVPLEEEMASCSIFLPEKSHEQRSLMGYSPWGYRESDMTEWLSTQAMGLRKESELEDISGQTTKAKSKRNKDWKTKQWIQGLRDNHKICNIHVLGVQEERRERKKYLEQKGRRIFPN